MLGVMYALVAVGVAIRYESLVILGIGLAAMVAVDRVINRTKMGAAIRAVAQEPEAAQMMGVNLDRTVDATFFLGSGLAAVAGILSGLYYSEIHFIMGITGGVIGFSAAAIGGAGHRYRALNRGPPLCGPPTGGRGPLPPRAPVPGPPAVR